MIDPKVYVVPILALAAAILYCVRKILAAKADLEVFLKRLDEQQAALKEQEQRCDFQLTEIKQALREAEERAGVLVAPKPPPSGLNLSKRSQVMRMARSGEKSENIAVALSLPRREVELVMKVQKIVLTSSGSTS